jgi:hypothetical protein
MTCQPCQLSRRQLAKVHRGRLGTHGFGSLSDRSWPILLKNSFLLEQKKFQGFLEHA